MNILVTGHKGYIGTHLVELLKTGGHDVVGIDIDYFAGCEWSPAVPPDKEILADIRTLTRSDLAGVECVMHLAAISNDPMGDLDEDLTYATNRDATISLARLAKQAGVPRFLVSGSCSVYGKGDTLDLDESAALNPVSAYAVSKVESESVVTDLADDDFSPTILRNATAYGHSPMLRIDLVANNLLGSALAYGEVRIMSDGSPWRPLIHCRDIARTFQAMAEADREIVHGQVVNVGGNAENYQVKDVADIVQDLIPDASIVYTGETADDPRSYRVVFDRLSGLLPKFSLEYTLRSGMERLLAEYREHGFSAEDFECDRWVRLRRLQKVLGAV